MPKDHANANRLQSLGLGQLSLVEHALCPANSKVSLVDNLVHSCDIYYTDKQRHRRKGTGTTYATFGLSSVDEFYLWGLLGLTFSQQEPTLDFRATPHFVLKSLGRIDQHAKRGGSAYQQFRDSLRRLAGVTYRSDCFYDPLRKEHREVAFGFMSYSLPLAPESSRAWRVLWDPMFFEFCQATGGRLFFDIDVYRTLDPTSRRLFLFLSKVFWRRRESGWFDVGALAYNILGISPSVAMRDIRSNKLARPIKKLSDLGILADSEQRKVGRGIYRIRFERGSYFDRNRFLKRSLPADSPLAEQLLSIGLDDASVRWYANNFKLGLLQEWADITLAAKEKYGRSFFKKSAAAYFVDGVKNAANGTRTAPDWWHDFRKKEAERQAETSQAAAQTHKDGRGGGFPEYLMGEGREYFERLMRKTFDAFVESGQSHSEAQRNAVGVVHEHLKRRFESRQSKAFSFI